MNGTDSVVARLRMLGLKCDDVPVDQVSSAIAALSCFPMYMVATVHAWTTDRQFKVPLLDIPGSEALRESVAIGAQEARLEISGEHSKVVGSMLTSAKPPDRVIYEYALETLEEYLAVAQPAVADKLRAAVARMIVAVARASGERLFGLGEKVAPEERECIGHIAARLRLTESSQAAAHLAKL